MHLVFRTILTSVISISYIHQRMPYSSSMGECQSCGDEINKAGHHLCYSCWKKQNGSPRVTPKQTGNDDEMLSATKIGEELSVSGQKLNLLFNELGWTYKPRHGKGWAATKQGKRQGAKPRKVKTSGVPYLVWPEKIIRSRVLRRAVADFKGEALPKSTANTTSSDTSDYDDFRKKYPADYRCMDGHYVRSRAEVMIDNWLYTNGIAHAYERKLPIESDVYSDFYIKAGNVYIEFWGMESDARYAKRKAVKQKEYADNEFNLIELNDKDLNHLDDILPRKMLQYGINVN